MVNYVFGRREFHMALLQEVYSQTSKRPATTNDITVSDAR